MRPHDILTPMRKTVEFLKKHPNKTFTLSEIASMQLMPWARDSRTIRKLIERDFEGANLLNATVKGVGGQRRYTMQAKDIRKYLQTYGPALMGTTRQLKNYDRKIGKKGGDRNTSKTREHLRGTQRLPRRAQANGKKRAR